MTQEDRFNAPNKERALNPNWKGLEKICVKRRPNPRGGNPCNEPGIIGIPFQEKFFKLKGLRKRG